MRDLAASGIEDDCLTVVFALFGSVDTANSQILSSPLGNGNSEILVQNSDFSFLAAAYGSESDMPGGGGQPAYDVRFDHNLDGFVDNSDFGFFQTNFGADWSF